MCRNPRCQDIVGMALVRRQELACRIGWEKDYFEPAPTSQDSIPGQTRPTIDPIRQRSGYQGTRPNDIIVGIEQPRQVAEQMQTPIGKPRTSNVGEAHRRALERRQIQQQIGDTAPPRRLTSPPVAPPKGDASMDQPNLTIPAARDGVRVSRNEGVSAPRRYEPPVEPIVTAPRDTTPVMHGRTPPPSAATEQTRQIPRQQPVLPPPGVQAAPRPYAEEPYQPPAPPPNYRVPPPNPPASTFAPTPPDPAPSSPLVAEWYAGERQRHRGKRCANCRDFQVAETGDRGWCRNRFAFPTPQLVGPNDLACLSCLGTWWAANDQWWQAKAAIPAQTVETPNADALLEEMREEEKRQATFRRPGTG